MSGAFSLEIQCEARSCHLHHIPGEDRWVFENRQVTKLRVVDRCRANYSLTDKTIKEPETPFPDLCATYASLWKDFDNQAVVASEPTIEAALNLAKRISAQAGGMQVFVTGSLHLVGGALNLLRP